MKKLRKWAAWAALTAIGLFIIAFIALKIFFPAEKVQAWVQSYVQNTWHRQVTFSDVSVNLIGITLNDFAISEYDTFEQGTFIKADRAVVKVALGPLLKKQIQITTVGLKGLQVNVVKNENGQFNFDDLVADNSSSDETASDTDTAASKPFFDLTAHHMYVKNCTFTYKDLQAGLQASLTKLNVDIKHFDLATPFDVLVQFTATYKDAQQEITLPVNAQLNVYLANLDLKQAYVTLQELTATYQGIKLFVKGNMQNFDKPSVNLQATLSGVSNTSLAKLVPDLPDFKLPAITLNTTVETDLEQSTAQITQTKLAMGKSTITVNGQAGWATEHPTYSLQSDLNLLLEPVPAMSSLLDGMTMQGKITGHLTATDKKDGKDVRGNIVLDNIGIQYPALNMTDLDGTIKIISLAEMNAAKITGKLNGESFSTFFTYKDLGKALDILFQLDLSKLTLTDLPVSTTGDASTTVAASSEKSSPAATSTPETLFNVRGSVNIGEINIPHFTSQGATLNINLQNASASLGQANGRVSFLLREGGITDLMGFAKENKVVRILLLPITVINTVTSKLGINLLSKSDQPGLLKFSSTSGTYVFTKGLMNIQETHLNSSVSDIQATGNVNFQSEAIDMRVRATVLTAQTPIIIKIGGTLSNPSGKLDVTKTAVSLVGGILNYKAPGKVASSGVKTAAGATKSVVNTGTDAAKATVDTAVSTVKSIGSLFKKKSTEEKSAN